MDDKPLFQHKQLELDSMPSTIDGLRPDQIPHAAPAKYELGKLLICQNNRTGPGDSPKSPKRKASGATDEAK